MRSRRSVHIRTIPNTGIFPKQFPETLRPMAKQIFDVIVIGTGAGGGMAIKTLCEAGLKVCALNAGRKLDPGKDFKNHRMPWDMKFRGYDDPKKRAQSYGYMDNEYTAGIWEHE